MFCRFVSFSEQYAKLVGNEVARGRESHDIFDACVYSVGSIAAICTV